MASTTIRCAVLLLVVGSSVFATDAHRHRQLLSSSSSLSSSSAAAVVEVSTRPAFVLTSSSSSEGSSASSEAPLDTVLTFTASLPVPSRRLLLTRPDNTCGTGALAKDKELAAIVEWMWQLAELLGVRRVDITAQGLAVTGGNTLTFTVYVVHAAGDFSTFSAQTLAGAPVSAGVLVPLANLVDGLTFHRGDKVVLEENLQQNPPSAAPTAIVECDQVLGLLGVVRIPGKRRHLLATPTPTASMFDIVLPIIANDLRVLASIMGVDESSVTATGLQIYEDDSANEGVSFFIFASVPESNATSVIDLFTSPNPGPVTPTLALTGTVTVVSEGDAPTFDVSLETNLLEPVPGAVQSFFQVFLDELAPSPTATPVAATGTTTPVSTTTSGDQVLALMALMSVPDRKRRHLLVAQHELFDTVLPIIANELNVVAGELGVDESSVTATGLEFFEDDDAVFFFIFASVPKSNANSLIDMFTNPEGQEGTLTQVLSYSGTVIVVNEGDAPSFDVALETNLAEQVPGAVKENFMDFINLIT